MSNKLKILMCSDDPDTILSYGLLSKMLIDEIHPFYDIHYVSLQRPYGVPINREGKYIKYAGKCREERNPINLPRVMNELHPDIFWTNFDIQHYEIFHNNNYVPKSTSWCGWVPWDNEDYGQIGRAKAVLRNVDVKVAISQFGFEFMRKHGIPIDAWIYNIVDTKNFYPISQNNKNFRNFKKSKNWYNKENKYLLFVGRPNWRKRIPHMFGIMRELKNRGRNDIKLILHSNVNDSGRIINIPEVLDAFGLWDTVIATAFPHDEGVSKTDLRYLYNMADLYLATHAGEGFGMPIAEAMACKTPFIASDFCTTREFAGDLERGFPAPIYYPRDPQGNPILDGGVMRPYPVIDKFADIIEFALDNPNKLETMGEKGAEWVKQWCSPEVTAHNWRQIFDSFNIKYGKVEYP